ncbi:glutamate ABC transporter substrate-binding protein [Nocardia sp. NPDC005998]|uniref:glutamate ABC transporter substrate-binding protein n=1 Tax=Nocardia sp. NPDC005998 TaxID=3156894 RepID=UPI0033BCE872
MKRSILTVGLASGVVLAACVYPIDHTPWTVTIGIKFDQPGLSVMGEDGIPHGFDVDTAIYIAKYLGVDAERISWLEAPSDRREALLDSGEVDFVVASYSITAARQQAVSFAGPYLLAGQDLLVLRSAADIDRPEALDGRTVCTGEGSTSADKIKRDFATGVRVTLEETYSTCVDELLAGEVDAVSTDDVILAGFAAQHPNELRVVGHPFTRERYGVGVEKGDTVLQSKITNAIQAMIADGTWARAVAENIEPSGYRPLPAPLVFNPPDARTTTNNPSSSDPALTEAVGQLAATANARQWQSFAALICPEALPAVNALVVQYTPQYDGRIGPEVEGAGFTTTITGITQTGPDSATFLAHESFTNVPAKYRQYFKDIDYTGTMARRGGTWKLCGLAADFVEP